MFGGKWMDIFVDKLSQKLTAQEMIKANAAADAAELQKVKGQVGQYDALLKEIQEVNAVNVNSAKQVGMLAAESIKKLENVDKMNRLIDAGLAKIEEIKADDSKTEELKEQLSEQLTQLREHVDALQAELLEHIHTEDVKVYRNVQAVIVEESGKLAEQNNAGAAVMKKVSGKSSAVMIFSILTLIMTIAGLILQILSLFGVI